MELGLALAGLHRRLRLGVMAMLGLLGVVAAPFGRFQLVQTRADRGDLLAIGLGGIGRGLGRLSRRASTLCRAARRIGGALRALSRGAGRIGATLGAGRIGLALLAFDESLIGACLRPLHRTRGGTTAQSQRTGHHDQRELAKMCLHRSYPLVTECRDPSQEWHPPACAKDEQPAKGRLRRPVTKMNRDFEHRIIENRSIDGPKPANFLAFAPGLA